MQHHPGEEPLTAQEHEGDMPLITIAIPLLNEAPRLPALLDALLEQSYPSDHLQILLLDGGSEDGTLAWTRQVAAAHDHIYALDNPNRTAAAALNLALVQAEGHYFIRFDARCRPAADYIVCAVRRLQEGAWAGVAGPQIAVGDTPATRAHALVLNHPLGTGAPRYRRANQPLESETIFLGAYPLEWLQRVGGWDNAFAATEDYEINTRIRKAGGRLLVDPAIRSLYVVRDSIGDLARQYARYGAWRTITWRKHPEAMKLRHLAPALLVASLALAAVFSLVSAWPLLILLALYLISLSMASLKLCLKHGVRIFPRILLVFITLHLAWGTAFWRAWLLPPARPPD